MSFRSTGAPDTALENCRDSKFFTDCAAGLLRVAILHYRRPGNHLEVANLCQLGEDVVVNTVRKELGFLRISDRLAF